MTKWWVELTVVALVLLVVVFRPGEARDVSPLSGLAQVETVTLKDGTLCAILRGPSYGGITCNWR